VERVEQGTPRPLPPGVDLTAYRIVQEALTNVTKHAGTPEARVRLAWDRGRLTLTVADDGPGGRTGADAGTGPGASAAGDRTGPGARTGPGGSARTAPGAARDRTSGYGLIGMRERATAVGGRLTAGPRPEGGFLVTADLPFRQRGDAQDAADADAADVPDGWDAAGGVDGEDGDGR
jgi:signal transduction histidine kinase